MHLLPLNWNSCVNGVPVFLWCCCEFVSESQRDLCVLYFCKIGLQISLFLHCWIIVVLTPSLESKSSQCHHKLILIHELTGKLFFFQGILVHGFPFVSELQKWLSHQIIPQCERKWRSLVGLFSFGMYSLFLGGKSVTNLGWSFLTIHSVLKPCSYPCLNVRDRN